MTFNQQPFYSEHYIESPTWLLLTTTTSRCPRCALETLAATQPSLQQGTNTDIPCNVRPGSLKHVEL